MKILMERKSSFSIGEIEASRRTTGKYHLQFLLLLVFILGIDLKGLGGSDVSIHIFTSTTIIIKQ